MQPHEQIDKRPCCSWLIKKFDIYKTPSLYDDQYWWKKDDIEFYKSIMPPGCSVLELGSGTGRVGFPLLRNDINYFALELSEEFCRYTKNKLLKKEHQDRIMQGDMRSFNIDRQFDCIFIAFNTFLHLLTNSDAERCFQCIRKHLSPGGEFILDIVHPHPSFLFKSSDEPVLVMDFKDSRNDDIVEIYEHCEYSNETEICDIRWEYRYKTKPQENKEFNYQMRMYYPDTVNRLLVESNFSIQEIYGDYEMAPFNEGSHLQIYRSK